MSPVDERSLNIYGIKKRRLFLVNCKIGTENNLEMMFDAYIQSKSDTPYYVIGIILLITEIILRTNIGIKELYFRWYF